MKVNDIVIDVYGNIGKITSFCNCDKCKKRGFYEPQIECINNDIYIYMTDYDYEHGFNMFYRIGDKIYPEHLDMKFLKEIRNENQKSLNILDSFFEMIKKDNPNMFDNKFL